MKAKITFTIVLSDQGKWGITFTGQGLVSEERITALLRSAAWNPGEQYEAAVEIGFEGPPTRIASSAADAIQANNPAPGRLIDPQEILS